MASTPPHCSITATTKRYQNHSYPHNQLKDHRQTHNQNPHQRWTSNQRVSLAKPPLPASSRNAPKPAATTTTTTTQHPQIHPTFPSFQPPKSELVSDFPGRRSTRFVSKLHFGRPRTTMGTRHTSVAQEALQNVIECGKDERALENVLLNFESRLSGSDDYVFLLRELGNRGDCKKAICCFEFAVKRERKKNEQGKLASAMISTLGRLGKVEMAKTVFEAALIEGYGNTVYAFSAIISAYGRSGYCNEAIKIFYSMKDYGLKPNLVTYNAVIDASGKGGVEFKRVLEIFDEMLRNGMQPDRITFNSLLAVCSKGGLWEAARSLSCEMVNRGIDQDIFTYNTLLDAVCKGGQLDMAFEIMSEMPAKNILPNVVTYSTMIDGYAKAGRLDDARNLFNEMKFLGISLDRVSYNTLLSIYAKLGRFEEAMDVCREMENSGIRKDVVTYNALLGGYGKQYKYDVVRKVFEEMKARHVSPNLLTYSTLIDVYSKGGLYREAMDVFREFKKAGLKADVVLYSALIDALCKNGLVESAVSLLDEMTKEGIRPNVVTYNSIIDAFGRPATTESVVDDAGQTSELQVESLSSSAVEKATKSLVADREDSQIIKIFGQLAAEKAGQAKNSGGQEMMCILGVFHKMHELEIKPNVVTFSAILNACSHSFMEKSDNVCVRFTGKNYAAWTFQLEIFLKGKELWGHIDGSDKDMVAEGSVVAKAAWAAKDAQIMSWILSSMEPHLILSLRPYRSAKAMWDHLTQVYNQDNNARRFQLELTIANYSQGDLSIQDYYCGFLALWSDYSDLVTAKVSAEGVLAVQQVHKISQRDQFLMKLRPEYEPVRASLVNRDPVPSLDACFGELLREEQRLHTQTIMEQARVASASVSVAYVASAYSKGKSRDMSKTQCYSCKKYGHIAPHCPHKICNYCKQLGHIIKECPIRPPPRPNKAYHAAVTAAGSSFSQTQPPANLLTREMVQEMIVSAFSTLGLQGTGSSALTWILDSGASNHMKNSLHGLSNIRKYCGSSHIQTANGSTLPIIAVGDVPPFLKDVYVSPKLAINLASVGQLVDNNCDVNFSNRGCIVQDQMSGQLIAKGPKHGRLFSLQLPIPRTLLPSSVLAFFCTAPKVSNEVWHKRLGHPNPRILSHLLKSGLISNKEHSASTVFLDCATCKLGKSKILPFPSAGSRATNPFEIIHSDVWGISPVISHANYRYFVTFIDDYSRYTWVYFLRNKSEVFSMFKLFLALVNTQFSATVKTLRSDSGGEYMSHAFQSFLQSNGIVSQRSCSYTPQQNGVAERKNRHLLDMVRTLLIESFVPPKFWVEALITATYLINRLPSQVLGLESPYFRLHHCHPIYNNLHTFGCVCFMHLPPPHRNKLSAQSIRCAFLGYSITQKGYLCFDPHTNHVHVSRNVIFFENQCFFPLSSSSATSLASLPSFDDSSPLQSVPVDRFQPHLVYKRRLPVLPPSASVLSSAPPLQPSVASEVPVLAPLRRSSRISVPPAKYGFTSSVAHHSTAALSVTLSSISIPTGYSQAATEPCWQQAMQEELNALEANQTWDIVDCPSGVTPLGCRWVYSIKIKADGSLDRYKARLVALGNHQKYGEHYEETFAPVAKMGTIRTILAIAASQHWCLHQLDVKNAFLHGDLTEDIYMRPPAGLFSTPTSAVCKLRRSLYGLKQAPRAWYERFTSVLLQFDFLKSKYDASLFLRKTANGVVFLLVYVDDIVITGTDFALINQLKQHLQKSFHMKDLGPLTYFLGLEIHAGSHGIFLSQHKYAMDLVAAAGLQHLPPLDTPMEINLKLRKDEGDLLSDPAAYRTLVGSLLYLTHTRPDISFAVQQVSQFMASPRHLHMAAVRRIIRYIHGTIRRGLCYPAGTSLDLIAYSDADYAGCSDTRRSITGWCMFLGPALISWKSKKQDRVSKSSTESEYRAMSQACSEIIWLHGLLAELGFQQRTPTPLFADNTSAIHLTANPIFHERTKHIEVDCHFIRDAYATKTISFPHVSSNLQSL